MKIFALFKKIIFSTGFLAAIPAVLFFLLLPSIGSKYSLSVEPADGNERLCVFSDLNSDGISEMVFLGKGLPYFFISVRDNDLRFYDQWNLIDSVDDNISNLSFGNYDHDRFQEIYIFTHKKDSLFLNVNELLESEGTKTERVFITRIGFLKGEVTSVLFNCGFYDENGDGKDEFYFGISTGFGSDPRRVYSYDLVNKKLNSSPFTGTICLFPQMSDVDGDKRPEIFGTMSASGNFGTRVPFSDSSTWFMVFNDKLMFKFPPEEFRGYVNSLEIKPFRYEKNSFFVLSHWAGGTDTSVLKSRVMIYTPEGDLIKYRLYSVFGISRNPWLFISPHNKADRIYIFGDKFLELNENLELMRTVELPFRSAYYTYQTDLNNDGKSEFMIYCEDEERLEVFSAGFKKMAGAHFKTPSPAWRFSHYYSRDHMHKLFLNSGDKGYFLSLKSNKYYYLGYLSYPGIYLLSFFFIFLIKKISTLQVVEKERLKRRLVTLQLQGIKSQLDPHFTFNTLNSVASLIYLEDRQAAYDYMNKFTQLLRGMLNDAERIYRSVGEEVEFVTTYLDLEKLRFGDKFDFRIDIGEGVNMREQIPKLVLHTFAENAIKHGLMPLSEGGLLIITIDKQGEYLVLAINDNGIGREKSKGRSTSTGKGLKLTTEFYDILNQVNKKPIKYNITDLYNEDGKPAGTRVEVKVPFDLAME